MRSPSNYSFAINPSVTVPRSSFKRDRSLKTAFDSGYLVPFFSDEVYPGDTFNVRTSAFARLSTPVVPFMDNLKMNFFFFFVPYRLLWEHWVNFNGEQANPNDSTDYLTPILATDKTAQVPKVDSISSGSLFDYLGFPIGTFGAKGLTINAFLPRAYNKIFNDHFRDENLVPSVPENVGDGPDNLSDYTLLKRCKRHDYFTSCLPWPQKGPGVGIGLSGNAPCWPQQDSEFLYMNAWGSKNVHTVPLVGGLTTGTNIRDIAVAYNTSDFSAGDTVHFASKADVEAIGEEDPVAPLYADLTQASAITINSLRTAFQIQKLYERDARGGTRYFEILRNHFGVVSPDARLQRSEYLGGGSIPINIHSVAQTSSSDDTTPQGNLAAYGVAGGSVGFSKSFVEHGVILGLVCVNADLTYQQGLHRSWSRRTRFDYYWPSLAHLGEQAVLNKEIFARGTDNDDQVFGYQERWAELRYGVSQITGKLRSGAFGSLDVWHLAQHFRSLPTLNQTFIEENPPLARVLAVQDEPQIIFDSVSQCNCVRCLPTYSIPGLVDHF